MIKIDLFKICVICGFVLFTSKGTAQSPQLDYSKFLHTSQRHSSLACNSCHERTDNSATPRFRVTKPALTVIADSSRRPRFRCALSATQTSAATILR